MPSGRRRNPQLAEDDEFWEPIVWHKWNSMIMKVWMIAESRRQWHELGFIGFQNTSKLNCSRTAKRPENSASGIGMLVGWKEMTHYTMKDESHSPRVHHRATGMGVGCGRRKTVWERKYMMRFEELTFANKTSMSRGLITSAFIMFEWLYKFCSESGSSCSVFWFRRCRFFRGHGGRPAN